MATYLAQPPAPCCLRGNIHTGTPVGTETQIAGLTTYVASPPAGVAPNGNVVFYFPDIWGLSVNAKLLMDAIAAAGYTVLGVDYFRNDPITKYRAGPNDPPPPGFDFPAWAAGHAAFAREQAPVWAAAAKTAYGNDGVSRYACVGYCFGGPSVCRLLADGTVAAGAAAHPTGITDALLRAVRAPLLLSCGADDAMFPAAARRQALDILAAQATPYHEQLFGGVGHGFAARGNLSNPYERWAKEQSLQGIISWFNVWLKA